MAGGAAVGSGARRQNHGVPLLVLLLPAFHGQIKLQAKALHRLRYVSTMVSPLGVILLVFIVVEFRQPARREWSDDLRVKAQAPSGAGDGDGRVTTLLEASSWS